MAHALTCLHRSMGRGLKSALSRVPTGFAGYLDARNLLRGSISKQSRQGLDWLNFFLADVQTGFGAFVAFYLAELGWQKSQVGLVLAAGTVAALVAQIPGGALVDAAAWKRGLAAIGICMIGASALILALGRLSYSYLSPRSSMVSAVASSRQRLPRLASVWSAAARCRQGPDATFALMHLATSLQQAQWD